MKKTLLAMAVLAASGAAFAQSSVTLFGVVDATLAFGKGSVANKTALTNSGYNSSRLGFRGTEDLGGGMKANFHLEAGVNNDDGTGGASNTNNQSVGAFDAATGANSPVRAGTQGLTFNRRSVVSLSGNFGEVQLGRDYTPHFYNVTAYEPFGTNGVGTSQLANSGWIRPTSVRASNSIAYNLPGNLGGFGGQVMYYMGENVSTAANEGKGLSFRANYNAGPISAQVAYGKTDYASGSDKVTNFGASYDFGAAKLMGVYAIDNYSGVKSKGMSLGVTAPVGQGDIRAAYSTYKADASGDKSNKIALGYNHNLSKRTVAYATFARVTNTGAAKQALNGSSTAAGGSSTGYDFGIRHSF
jgi:predicted porin